MEDAPRWEGGSFSKLLEALVHLLEVLGDLLGVLVEHVLRLLQHPRARAQVRRQLLLHAVHLRQGRAEFQGCNEVGQVRCTVNNNRSLVKLLKV